MKNSIMSTTFDQHMTCNSNMTCSSTFDQHITTLFHITLLTKIADLNPNHIVKLTPIIFIRKLVCKSLFSTYSLIRSAY